MPLGGYGSSTEVEEGQYKPIWLKLEEFVGHLHRLVPSDYQAECRCRAERDDAVTEDGVGDTIAGSSSASQKK